LARSSVNASRTPRVSSFPGLQVTFRELSTGHGNKTEYTMRDMSSGRGKKGSKRRVSKASYENALDSSPTPPPQEAERRFPAHLFPIIQDKRSVLDRSKLDSYFALIIGVLSAVLPMSALTRSLLLLLVLAPLLHIVLRSPWSHAWKRTSKIIAIWFLAASYMAIAATLVLSEHLSILNGFRSYVNGDHAERFLRWFYFAVGFTTALSLSKLTSLTIRYLRTRRATRVAKRRRFRETQKGWLDYRLQSEESSKRLHFCLARLKRVIGMMAFAFKHLSWFTGKEGTKATLLVKQATADLLIVVLELCGGRLGPDTDEMEASANLFIESTEGYLKTTEIITRRDYEQLAGLHEYFTYQLRDIRDITNVFDKFPPAFERARGVSQELTAAINRQASIWRSQAVIMRRVEAHCIRMVKATQESFDRSILKASQELLAVLQDIVKRMSES
jgi:hypothetical protein